MDEHEPVYTMAVAARLTTMHPQTLRKYERAGLIEPHRQAANQRLYSGADLSRLRRIQYLVEDRGLNIAGLEMMLTLVDRLDAIDRGASAMDIFAAIGAATSPTRVPEGNVVERGGPI